MILGTTLKEDCEGPKNEPGSCMAGLPTDYDWLMSAISEGNAAIAVTQSKNTVKIRYSFTISPAWTRCVLALSPQPTVHPKR